jgi:hypothetical protein
MISVKKTQSGKWAVIDGMHRVTSLQQLCSEGHVGPTYEKVFYRQSMSLVLTDLCPTDSLYLLPS